MAENDYWAPGQWNFFCDLCGKKAKSGTAVKTWDGFYVCAFHKEVRNPQDFLRGVKDDQHVPWSRHEAPDQYVPQFRTLHFDEAITLSEAFFIQGNAKSTALSDAPPVTEVFVKKLNKVFSEAIPVVEAYSNRPTSIQSDSVPLAESMVHGEHPNVNEAMALAETNSFAFVKVISENVGIAENVLFPVATQTGLNNAALNVIALN